MKKVLVVICILCVLLFVGCEFVEVERQGDSAEHRETKSTFVVLEETASWKIIYHRETKVMYAVSYGVYNCGTFTLLVNADGTPMLWEGEQK